MSGAGLLPAPAQASESEAFEGSWTFSDHSHEALILILLRQTNTRNVQTLTIIWNVTKTRFSFCQSGKRDMAAAD